ncbi:MAG: POTRA domain-containing protein [Pirellulaceae bacterium]
MKHAAPRQRVRKIRLLMSVPLILATWGCLLPVGISAQDFGGPQLGSPGMNRPGTGPYGGAPSGNYPPPQSAPEQIPPRSTPPGEAPRQTLPQPGLMPAGATRPPIAGIRISGNNTVSENRVRSMIKSREGREFDPELIQSDVRRLASSGMFRDVQILTDTSEQGVFVTFQVQERPTIGYIKFLGNQSNRQSSLLKKSGLSVGAPMNKFQVEEARVKLEDYFRNRGHGLASVKVVEGLKPDDPGVVFMIHEGPLARVSSTTFVGNTIASEARLKTQIKTKPGIFWILWGKFDRSQLEQDLESITSYYRSLGYFQARVNRILDFDEEGKWVDVQFIVDEGPRYMVRNVSFVGQTRLTAEQLATQVKLESGQYFDQKKMNADVSTISDVYGSQGYIHADVDAQLRFLEKPGELDLVYDIAEGSQYRVGEIHVQIEGDNPHTKHAVVMNRLGFQPGEIIDIRKIRDSERRLKYSQLFMNEPHRGISPTITVKPPELEEMEQFAEGRSGTMRGQSPTPSAYQATPPRFQPAYPSQRPPEYQPPGYSADSPPAYRSESPPEYQPMSTPAPWNN